MRRVLLLALVATWMAPSPATADERTQAEQLYNEGQVAFDAKRFDEAVAAWERSYVLSGEPGLRFNLGQAYRLRARPGDCTRARAEYQTFVQQSAPSPERTAAEGYIAELAACATAPSIGAPSSETASARERSIHNRTIAAAAIGGGGGAVLVVGLYFGYRASARGDDVTALCSMGCEASYVESQGRAGRREATIGRTLDVIGVAALLGGAALYWFGVHDAGVRVEPVTTHQHQPTGAVLSWSGTW